VALPPYLSEAEGATLAKAAGVPPSSAELVRGASARDKLVRLPGVAAADAAERLR
jgi:uncharacterized protein YggU (UPF0235/DUF167 family)